MVWPFYHTGATEYFRNAKEVGLGEIFVKWIFGCTVFHYDKQF